MSRFIQTYSGRRIEPYNPDPDAICVLDIAHHLSMLCRFTGAVRTFYSVAQHSVLVSALCDPEDALAGLLHDAEEYVFADLNRPVKYGAGMENYQSAARHLRAVIFEKYGLPAALPESVVRADANMLFTERRDLLAPLDVPEWGHGVVGQPYQSFTIEPWTPAKAREEFCCRFAQLDMGMSGQLQREGWRFTL